MDKMFIHPHFRNIDLPDIDKIDVSHVFRWLAQGWKDLWRALPSSLGYGLVFAWLGYLLVGFAWERLHLAMAFTTGFLLVAPFLAVGFYDLSRQMAGGERPSFLHSLRAWRESSIGLFGLLLAIIMVAWERLSAIIVALFLGGNIVSVENFVTDVLYSGEHTQFVMAYGLFGLMLAAIVFALSVVSLPMLVDRKADLATALMTSLWVVRENPFPMLVWAGLIALLTALGFATYFVGLVIVFPLLGHATWHAYRDLVEKG
jgi:uncharacterized membrane protein